MEEGRFKQYFATVIFLSLSALLLFTVYTFINGFFGALLLYVISSPLHRFFVKRKLKKRFSAVLVVTISFFVIVLPLLLVLGFVGNQLLGMLNNLDSLSVLSRSLTEAVSDVIPSITPEMISQRLSEIAGSAVSLIMGSFSNIVTFIINLSIALYLLYYMLLETDLFGRVENIIPFNKKNSRLLVEKLKDISYSTVIVGGIIAIVQGGLLALSFVIFGVKGAFMWGSIAAILSFLPLIGPPLIWIPACIVQFIQGNTLSGFGILGFGMVLSNIDNFLRPFLGKTISRIHPLVTFIGVFLGVGLFGIIGVFAGPLLLGLSILVLRMFKEEYVN